jgi:excisionase family DNA binding protein
MPLPKQAAAPTLPRMFSIAEIAEMFGRAPRTIRSWIADGRLQAVKIGHAVFIPQAQIDALLSTLNTSKFDDSRRSQDENY